MKALEQRIKKLEDSLDEPKKDLSMFENFRWSLLSFFSVTPCGREGILSRIRSEMKAHPPGGAREYYKRDALLSLQYESIEQALEHGIDALAPQINEISLFVHISGQGEEPIDDHFIRQAFLDDLAESEVERLYKTMGEWGYSAEPCLCTECRHDRESWKTA